MKRLFLTAPALIFTCSIFLLSASQERIDNPQASITTTIKATEAIIYDTYSEAMPLLELPPEYKKLLSLYGFGPNDVQFYTAVRMNHFAESVRNSIVLLRPNFFIYLSEQEQLAVIATQLENIRSSGSSESELYNAATQKFQEVTAAVTTATALALLVAYGGTLFRLIKSAAPVARDIVTSTPGLIIGMALAILLTNKAIYTSAAYERKLQNELAVLSKIGPGGLISLREKQVIWGKNNFSWLTYQWYKLLGKLYLAESAEAQLERYQAYLNATSHEHKN
jgi:hypothetical protein